MAADKAVLDAFNRFDTDGSGSISREELGEVLKALQSTTQWDDDSIDHLLAAADASGDGQLQVEEFVKWVFAEDEAISAGVKGQFTLQISGCSRADLNGNYVQQRDLYSRRPTFHCAENDRYLFYHGDRQQWQIFSRTGRYASARLKTSRAAHMPGEGKMWAVWKASRASKKKSFVKESQMKCIMEPPLTAEEQLAKTPAAIMFDGVLFKKMAYILGNRPVYHHKSERFIFYEAPKSIWKVGEAAVLGRDSLKTSRATDVYSPDLAFWMDDGGKISVLAVNADGIPSGWKTGLKINDGIADGWQDPDFPHNDDSIGEAAVGKYKDSRWVRALSLHPSPSLFANVEPADACQGIVGNCWLIAAMSAVAEFPSYIKNNLFVTKKVSRDGKYQVKLFDGRSKKWKLIEIDDYLPCTSWGGEMPQLLFGSIPDGKLCLALLEKAFAKLYGNWSALSAGFPEIAWFHMTSCTELFSYSTSYLGVEPKWQVTSADGIQVMAGYWGYDESRKVVGQLSEGATFGEKCRIGHWIEFRKIDGDGPDSGWLKYYGNGKRVAKRTAANDIAIMQSNVVIVPEQAMTAIGASGGSREVLEQAFRKNSVPNFVEPEELWQKLQQCDKGNYLMASSASTSKHERMSGLVHEHAYSVLHAVEVDGLRLVCCRNPWGSEAEWNGPWSDRSPEWKANPSIVEALNVDLFDFKTEGTFWMDFEDWLYVMGQLKIMNCRMPSTRGGFHHELVEEDEDEQAEDGKAEDEENEEDDHRGEPVTSCSGLFVDWHPPETLTEGTLLYPDKTYTFTNVPSVLLGGTYIGSQVFPPSGGTWTIEYSAPAKLFVWAAQGRFNGGVDEALQADGWEAEDPDGFHGGALALNLWSKRFDKGSSCNILLTSDSDMVGGVVGTAPCVQEKD